MKQVSLKLDQIFLSESCDFSAENIQSSSTGRRHYAGRPLPQLPTGSSSLYVCRYINILFSRRFWRKVSNSYSGLFFYTRKVHFFVHLFNLNTDEQSILEASDPRPKQTRRPESQKHTKNPKFGVPTCSSIFVFLTSIFFGTMRLFFRNFFNYTKGFPFSFFEILQQNGC